MTEVFCKCKVQGNCYAIIHSKNYNDQVPVKSPGIIVVNHELRQFISSRVAVNDFVVHAFVLLFLEKVIKIDLHVHDVFLIYLLFQVSFTWSFS